MSGRKLLVAAVGAFIACWGCAPIEYTSALVRASHAIAEAEEAGAGCTEEQLADLSPVTANEAPDPGTELVSSEDGAVKQRSPGEPACLAPFEYYSALEYREKAREEVSYADYEPALLYAKEAVKLAQQAVTIARNPKPEKGE